MRLFGAINPDHNQKDILEKSMMLFYSIQKEKIIYLIGETLLEIYLIALLLSINKKMRMVDYIGYKEEE